MIEELFFQHLQHFNKIASAGALYAGIEDCLDKKITANLLMFHGNVILIHLLTTHIGSDFK